MTFFDNFISQLARSPTSKVDTLEWSTAGSETAGLRCRIHVQPRKSDVVRVVEIERNKEIYGYVHITFIP